MSVDIGRAVDFLDRMAKKHATILPMVKPMQVLTFMGTTGVAGKLADLSVHKLLGLEMSTDRNEVLVTLRGNAGRALEPGECASVSLNAFSTLRGYQVKTLELGLVGTEDRILETRGGDTIVHARSVYTVHNSPNALTLFEQVPWDDVQKDVGNVSFAILGVGPEVNISPRLVWHHELAGGKLRLYHGDGYVHKTFLNLQKNTRENRLVLDFDTLTGYCLHGTLSLLDPQERSTGLDKVVAGFNSIGWSQPRRSYCLTVDEVNEVKSWS